MKLGSKGTSLLTLVLAAATASTAEPPLTLDLGDGVKLDMVLVKKGQFRQGSPPKEAGRNDDETQRQVTLTRDFYLGKYPVTRGQFARFVAETKYRTEAERGPSGGFGWDGTKLVQRKAFTWRNPGFRQTDDHPVTVVTYDDAQAFAAWLTKKAGRPVTLPTEAQWELACRAGTTTRFYAGDAEDDARAIGWFKANAGDGTRPVGQKKPNAFGLYDMSGNVYQWCRDWYGPYPPRDVADPEETRSNLSDPPRRVLRGGSWLKEARHGRSAARFRNTPGSRNADNGFRVMVMVQAKTDKDQSNGSLKSTSPLGLVATAGLLLGQRDHGPSGSNNFFLCFLVFVGGVFILVAVAFKRSLKAKMDSERQPGHARSQRPPGRPGRFTPRVVDDGFWLNEPSLMRGSVIHYRYRHGGGIRTGHCAFEPGPHGHFVYTGETPSDIEVYDVTPPGPEARETWEDRPPSPPPSTSPPPSSFTGYPSAY